MKLPMKMPSKKRMEAALGGLDKWAFQCHTASLQLVRSGLLPKGARVVRGWHPDVTSQHSWVCIGDPYGSGYGDKNVPLYPTILDPTLWSYLKTKPSIAIGRGNTGNGHTIFKHKPHGAGMITEFDLPQPLGRPIQLDVEKLSPQGKAFLRRVAPQGLDFRGWHQLAHSPVQGWPSREIIGAMYDSPQLRAIVPIDIAGNVTDKNPGSLYW